MLGVAVADETDIGIGKSFGYPVDGTHFGRGNVVHDDIAAHQGIESSFGINHLCGITHAEVGGPGVVGGCSALQKAAENDKEECDCVS